MIELELRLTPSVFRPFPDAPAVPVLVAVSADYTRVSFAAGPGGGPRVSTFALPAMRPVSDVYVGDPATRGGVTGDFTPPDERHEFGSGPALVYVDTENPTTDREPLIESVADLFAGRARVTDLRPAENPLLYKTVVVNGTQTWIDATGRAGYPGNLAFVLPPDAPVVVAHEAGHLFGLAHTPDDPTDVMYNRPDGRAVHFSPSELERIR